MNEGLCRLAANNRRTCGFDDDERSEAAATDVTIVAARTSQY